MTLAASGYSGTPLVKKLGIKAGMRLLAPGAPRHYRTLLGSLPRGAAFGSTLDDKTDLVHLFATERSVLMRHLASCRADLRADAVIWVSWPKKAAKVATDVTEDIVREVALPLGFVDVKVCAIDEVWSGLKLAVRKALR
jgi:hypothetical protein